MEKKYIIKDTRNILAHQLEVNGIMERAPMSESPITKKLFSIYSTTQECDIIVGQKIVGQKGVETDEKKLSK